MGNDSTVVTITSDVPEPDDSGDESCLVVLHCPDLELGTKFEVTGTSLVIGPSSKVDVHIDEKEISRSHAVVEDQDGEILIRDLDSTNGTFVNNNRVEKKILFDGDQIKIGHTIFKFLSGDNIETDYHDEIYRLTTRDGLTGVHNKRHLLKQLDREMSRSIRYNRCLSILMFDLDHFKEINDTYGHLTGDHILQETAKRIEKHIRRDDIFARYGGEEFMIVLPEITKAEAIETGEKIRALIGEEPFYFDGADIEATISVGVAEIDEYFEAAGLDQDDYIEEFEALEFINIADERLYEAKDRGRNCVAAGE